VAGLESRLDTYLADDDQASAKQRAAEEAAKQSTTGGLAPLKSTDGSGSRDASRTRANERLAERLAKAAAAKTPTGSNVPSRTGTPIVGTESARASGEEKRSGEVARSVPDITTQPSQAEQPETLAVDEDASDEKPASDATTSASVSVDSSSRPSLELPNGHAIPRTPAELEAELNTMRQTEKQRQDEIHAYMEKIDALQAKLSYLANETVAAAKAANASTEANADQKTVAEKDERIALLMEEGEKLSKSEMKHLQTIKKLRTQKTEDDKITADAKKRELDVRQRLRRAEVEGRQANEKIKKIEGIEKQVDELRVDRENAAELVKSLTVQLKEAKEKTERVEKEAKEKANEVDKGRIAALENEVEDAQIERKLAEDRATAEIKKLKEDAEGQKQRFDVRELELKNEIASLESRLEAMRSRVEEASTGDGSAASGADSNVGLLRQVETLQRQYSLAKENWEAIEASLNGRLAALEKERDEASRRETDARKRARDAGTKARRTEEELESKVEEIRSTAAELKGRQDEVTSLYSRLDEREIALSDAKNEAERQKKLWEVELQQRIEEERTKWYQGAGQKTSQPPRSRKTSTPDFNTLRRPGTGTSANRLNSHDLSTLHTDPTPRPSSRRSSNYPSQTPATATAKSPSGDPSPAISRQESTFSLTSPADMMPPTPSIEIDDQEPFPDSPDRTINDLVSTSTSAGPTVQLVERMSAAVRRLESEKAGFKDEISRLSSQRDSARDEVVTLMREVEEKRGTESKVGELGGELETLKGRYEASLEMLGEREEEVEELRADVKELKRLYRELVEEKMGGR
jgi:myosin heavy subunit